MSAIVEQSCRARISRLIKALSADLYEREEVVAQALLAVLAGQSVFLYGPPGTGKSLLARRLSRAFRQGTHFEYLMQRFSTPDEIFGPVSIEQLKQDRFSRKTEGYLPSADIAFLDEIWKSGPAILNTLLTIINERVFRNGAQEQQVPLKGLLAASNETPPPHQGLEALYDRFIVRLLLGPLQERDHFEALLADAPASWQPEVGEDAFSQEEWQQLPAKIQAVQFSQPAKDIVHAVRTGVDQFNQQHPEESVYVSDRRWQRMALLLKAAAYFCDRQEVIPVDTLLLGHCLWAEEGQRGPLIQLVEQAVRSFGRVGVEQLPAWEERYHTLDREVRRLFFHGEDRYTTKTIGEVECFPIEFTYEGQSEYWFAPTKYLLTSEDFFLVDESGETQRNKVQGNFQGGKTLHLSFDSNMFSHGWYTSYRAGSYRDRTTISLKKDVTEGDEKPVSHRVRTSCLQDCDTLLADMQSLIPATEAYLAEQDRLNETPFLRREQRVIVTNAIREAIDDLKNHRLNAERLQQKVKNHGLTE